MKILSFNEGERSSEVKGSDGSIANVRKRLRLETSDATTLINKKYSLKFVETPLYSLVFEYFGE